MGAVVHALSGVGRHRRLLIAAGGGGVAGVATGTYGLVATQARLARARVGPVGTPFSLDGTYAPSAASPSGDDGPALRLAMVGDSGAAGLGAETPRDTPGAVLARGLAAATGRAVLLRSTAVVGARSADLAAQVDLLLEDAGGAPDAVAVLIGANDVTHAVPPGVAAARLAAAVERLVQAGVVVVVGCCPALGAVRPVPQPTRSLIARWSARLARAQATAVREVGGVPVALGDLLGPAFAAHPERFFSADRFHPSSEGYLRTAQLLLPPLVAGLSGVAAAPQLDAAAAATPGRRAGWLRPLPV